MGPTSPTAEVEAAHCRAVVELAALEEPRCPTVVELAELAEPGAAPAAAHLHQFVAALGRELRLSGAEPLGRRSTAS